MPMQRWIQSAAGGTSQRLKPAAAIVRSLSRIPTPAPVMVPAVLAVAIYSSMQPPVPDGSAFCDPVVPASQARPALLLCIILVLRQDRKAHPKMQTPVAAHYAQRRHAGRKDWETPSGSGARLNLRVLAEKTNWDRSRLTCR